MQTEDARARILRSAKEIFLEQGYKKATIRQIVRRSGLMIGSIYHFFENKEDIFRQLFLDIFDRCDGLICQRFGCPADAPLRLALMCSTMLQAAEMDENICELYGELLSLQGSAELHALHFSEWMRANLPEELGGQSEAEVFARSLAVSGILRGLLANQYHQLRLPLRDRMRIMIESSFTILGISPGRAAEITAQLDGLMEDMAAIAGELVERQEPVPVGNR